tara:strand:- start:2155 stop:2859 length:705 start_codon:yes stop_codon:yes gene_type:complete
MKIQKSTLKRLIKEELRNVLAEAHAQTPKYAGVQVPLVQGTGFDNNNFTPDNLPVDPGFTPDWSGGFTPGPADLPVDPGFTPDYGPYTDDPGLVTGGAPEPTPQTMAQTTQSDPYNVKRGQGYYQILKGMGMKPTKSGINKLRKAFGGKTITTRDQIVQDAEGNFHVVGGPKGGQTRPRRGRPQGGANLVDALKGGIATDPNLANIFKPNTAELQAKMDAAMQGSRLATDDTDY